MTMVVALPAAGEMGAGVGRVLAENRARVLTLTEGRSERTLRRASAAGMESVPEAALTGAEVILSIVPPGIALDTARRLARHFGKDAPPPLFIDCNAISPQTAREIAAVVETAGATFVDGGIIGGPPVPGKSGPRIYVSGDAAARAEGLARFGLDIRAIAGGIGAASALKMSYGGLTKGLTGIAAALILAAEREGVGAALHAELGESQAGLLKRSRGKLPAMYPKAYRWVAEMEAISAFIGADRKESAIWKGLGGFYARLAEDFEGSRTEIGVLDAFLKRDAES